MVKVVVNRCYGGFSISRACAEHMAQAGSSAAKQLIADAEKTRWYGFFGNDEARADPLLVAAIEELGDAANGEVARLDVVEVPDDVSWQIEEYDGQEWIAEKHRTW